MASATRKGASVQGTQGADEKLVRVLEETATMKLLEKLDSIFPGIVKEAVQEAIVYAMHNDTVALPKREPRSFAPRGEPRKPKEGGVCEAVWKELDRLYTKGQVPTLIAIQKVGEKKKWNANNVRVEYYQWRKDKGISGRASAPAAERPDA